MRLNRGHIGEPVRADSVSEILKRVAEFVGFSDKDAATGVLVLKRGRGKGYSGIENDLFVDPKTSMLFGDARQSLLNLGVEVKNK